MNDVQCILIVNSWLLHFDVLRNIFAINFSNRIMYDKGKLKRRCLFKNIIDVRSNYSL